MIQYLLSAQSDLLKYFSGSVSKPVLQLVMPALEKQMKSIAVMEVYTQLLSVNSLNAIPVCPSIYLHTYMQANTRIIVANSPRRTWSVTFDHDQLFVDTLVCGIHTYDTDVLGKEIGS